MITKVSYVATLKVQIAPRLGDARFPRHGANAAWTSSRRSPRSRSTRSAKTEGRQDAALHDQATKVWAERVPSKMQTVKLCFPSR
jgi:hypothetical protein